MKRWFSKYGVAIFILGEFAIMFCFIGHRIYINMTPRLRYDVVTDRRGHYRVRDKKTGYISEDLDSCKAAHERIQWCINPKSRRSLSEIFNASFFDFKKQWREAEEDERRWKETESWKKACPQ